MAGGPLRPILLTALVLVLVVCSQRQTPAVHAALPYPPGWNLVSGPEGSRLHGTLGPMYTLQPGDTSYASLPADLPLHGGWGYWAYFPLGGMIELAAGTAEYMVWPVPGSWVRVGNPSDSTDVYIAGADVAYTYTPGSGYRAVSVLSPGQGAFVSGTARMTIKPVGTPLFP